MNKTIKILLSAFIFEAVVSIINFVGCVDLPNDIIMPQWDVDLNIPLLKKSYILDDIVESEKEPNISIDPIDNLYVIQSDNYHSSTGVSQFLQVENESSSMDNVLPVVENDSLQLYVPFPDDIQIDRAVFKSGSIDFDFTNHSVFSDMHINIQIPGIIKPDGSKLSLNFIVHANSSLTSTYVLEDHNYQEPANQISFFKGQIWLIAKTSSLDSMAFASFNVITKKMKFKSANGYIPTKIIQVEQESYKVDLGADIENYKDKISLKDAQLNVTSQYITNVSDPCEIEIRNLSIVGKRNSGELERLLFYENVNSPSSLAFRFNNGKLQKIFDETNSNITDFISFLPDSIIVNADYVLNPDDDKSYRNVDEMDSVVFETNFNTKSSLVLKTTNITDTLDIDISDDNRNEISKAQSAALTITAENHIPLTAFFKITLADENYNPLFTLNGNDGLDSLQFLGASIDHTTGEVLSSTENIHKIILTGDKIQKLSQSKFAFISVSVRSKDALEDNQNPPFVTFHPTDWITLKSFGNIKYRLNSDNN